MQNKKATIILLISFFIGLSVLLYPSISSYWNSKVQSEAIIDYESMLANYKPEDYTPIFEAANAYNQELSALESPFIQYKSIAGRNTDPQGEYTPVRSYEKLMYSPILKPTIALKSII